MNKQRNTLRGKLALPCTLSILGLAAIAALLMRYLLPLAGPGWTLAALAVAGLALAAGWLRWVDSALDEPLDQLCEELESQKDGAAGPMDPELLEREDSVGALARAAAALTGQTETRVQVACTMAAQQAEARARHGMAEEICRSALPQVLPDIPSRANFEVCGRLERGQGKDCQFYDYFFIDPGLLCIMIGQTPGEGVAEALYMVVAQTTIRSRLRMGRSLEETMTDVNAQLYDLGNQFCLNALVATLSTADGRLTYVNAGQQQPLLMRNEDRYEWLESPVYAPLGMNENISYRAMELRLKQGDRLVLHTAGFASLTQDGIAYGERQLRADFNVTRSRELDSSALLQFVSEQALEYGGAQQNGGFALLTLLFCKGDKELAHCDVPARPEYAAEVTGFLKKQFADNGIDKRHYARQAVVVDEVFALCCRKAARDSHIMVECGVAPDAQMVNIRVTAVLGGVDPTAPENIEPSENAVEFIRENADYITFKTGEERDTITIVCFLG